MICKPGRPLTAPIEFQPPLSLTMKCTWRKGSRSDTVVERHYSVSSVQFRSKRALIRGCIQDYHDQKPQGPGPSWQSSKDNWLDLGACSGVVVGMKTAMQMIVQVGIP